MTIEVLSFLVLLSASIAIVSRQKRKLKTFSIFKPLTTVLIISIASLIFHKTGSTYSAIIIVALVFALIGDVFLITDKFFLPGLISFLMAHIFFIIGFTSLYGFHYNLTPLLPLLIIGGVYFNYLRNHLNKFLIPVLVYISIILVMNWQAINLMIHHVNLIFCTLAAGSILFSFSDSILAYDKFKKPFKSANILILSTYWISIFIFTIIGIYID